MDGVLDILALGELLGRGRPHRDAAHVRRARARSSASAPGVLNLGIEGIFTAGAMAGWLAVYLGGGSVDRRRRRGADRRAFGLLHALLTVPLGLSQHVTGIGVTLLATSARPTSPTASRCRTSRRRRASSPSSRSTWPACRTSRSSARPCSSRRRSPISPSRCSPRGTAFVLYRTPLGLAIRAVGENPAAVEAQGLDVMPSASAPSSPARP